MSDWHLVHDEIVILGRNRAQHEHALCRALVRARRARIWEPFGAAHLFEYAERYIGLTPRQTEERVRVGEALEQLPRLDAALAEARLSFSAVRELTRVAIAETEAEWLEKIAGMTVGEIEDLVSGRSPGDRPSDPARPRRHRIVIDVSAETYAIYRDAQAALRRAGDVSEEDTLALMARATLGGPGEERSSYQIRMTVCETCGRAEQEGRGRSIPVERAAAEQALCDAQRLTDGAAAKQDIPPATRRLVVRRHHGRCATPGCRNATFTDVHHITPRSEGGTHDPDQLVVLCSAHHAAIHRGTLRIEGTWSKGLRFSHADGSPYGSAILDDVHQVLRGLGFKEREARSMVDSVRPHVGVGLEGAIRLALRAAAAPRPSVAV